MQKLERSAILGVAIMAASLALAKPAGAADPPPPPRAPFVPTAKLDIPTLAKLLLERAPSLQDDLLRLDLARADVIQARLWENPALDATWGTVPIGERNPSTNPPAWSDVPNYSVGLSYRFLLGKRGPRTDRARALERSTHASVEAAARSAALSLAAVLGSLAASSVRFDRLQTLLNEGKSSLEVARARVNAGSGFPLEVDRLEIELSRIEQQALNAESDQASALATCSSFVGVPCAPFPSAEEGRQFLTGFVARAGGFGFDIRRRPDVRALEAEREAAVAELEFARAQAIPDPTIRVGYTYDRFVVSGNQQQSLNFTLSFPLPIVDYGQAQRAAAEAHESRARLQRDRVADAARARVESLRRVLERTLRRQTVIETQMLPRARAVVGDLEKAVTNRLIPVTDLIQARRTLGELLLEETDAYGDAFRAAVELMGELAFGDIPLGDMQ